MAQKFNTRYRRPPKIGLAFREPSLTVQSARDESMVQNILHRFVATGDLGYFGGGAPAKPFFGDFSETPDFQTAMTMQAQASEYFDGLPSNMRLQFGNDFRNFIKFIGDANNNEKAIEMGLLQKLPEPVKDVINNVQQTVNNNPSSGDVQGTVGESNDKASV